ncbi:hypothetical protein RDWZM_002424 [Blomia tropicalis]|uniref:G2/mitotic-specific cyclin-B3 n=1 Tax=Blomia tropicalis TaxID=40697 RepID=A0A9Q0ME95_BLOTA|nr:Protein kinase binding [Blomia tropicalis]KAJ6223879.1 hypothetical protein RDWZM_002424 [Blomia tropicalis]
MPRIVKHVFGNVSNIPRTSKNHKVERNNIANLKRTIDSSPSFKNKKLKGQENDPTRSIECKIKKIAISENCASLTNNENKLVRAVKSTIAIKEPVLIKKTIQTGNGFINWEDYYETPESLPKDVVDYDRTQLGNAEAEPIYAYEIFQYLKQKEQTMKTVKYMHNQTELTDKMRMVLVDWMVEVQQTFELNHETLYLGVKFVDHFLMRSPVTRNQFQLVGLTALFIACKFDERVYPVIDDFIYISDDAFNRGDFIRMEIEMLKTLQFNLNFPLSYSFLRRYARCSSLSIETLTLARYILETSLLDYTIIDELDSKLAAAALLLALKMRSLSWNKTLEFYSGYNETELNKLMVHLNNLISTLNPKYETIKSKYSDGIFHEVALIKPLQLQDGN